MKELTEYVFKRVKIVDAIKIPETSGNYTLVKDRWWCVTEDDCILYYKDTLRQSNQDKGIAEHIVKLENHPATKVVFLPNVWEKHTCQHD